jgi:Zn finger protein HypA/HybF involved in hydrogenase expression
MKTRTCWTCGQVFTPEQGDVFLVCPCGMHNNMTALREGLEMSAKDFKDYVAANTAK